MPRWELAGRGVRGCLLRAGRHSYELGHAIVEGPTPGTHLEALLKQFFYLGVDVEVRGVGGQGLDELVDLSSGQTGRYVIFRLKLATFVGIPVVGELGKARLVVGLGSGLLVVEELLLDMLGLSCRVDADLLRVDEVEWLTILDDGIAAGWVTVGSSTSLCPWRR